MKTGRWIKKNGKVFKMKTGDDKKQDGVSDENRTMDKKQNGV
jgi:hypothetical protein